MKNKWLFMFIAFFILLLFSILFLFVKTDGINQYDYFCSRNFFGRNMMVWTILSCFLSFAGSAICLLRFLLSIFRIGLFNKFSILANIVIGSAILFIGILFFIGFCISSKGPTGSVFLIWCLIISQLVISIMTISIVQREIKI